MKAKKRKKCRSLFHFKTKIECPFQPIDCAQKVSFYFLIQLKYKIANFLFFYFQSITCGSKGIRATKVPFNFQLKIEMEKDILADFNFDSKLKIEKKLFFFSCYLKIEN